MKLIRLIVGKILIFLDFLTSPKPGHRSKENKESVQQVLKTHSLYEFKACPFCIKVKRRMKALNLDIELRDAKNDEKIKNELVSGGGRHKVPCLKIETNGETKWMYESNDIIAYLEKEFPLPSPTKEA